MSYLQILMSIEASYDHWAEQYDRDDNKTRDLEQKALQENLAGLNFENCLEIGCGTGKNTDWLSKKAKHLTAVDLSENMLVKAKEKISAANVHFIKADIEKQWDFTDRQYGLISFSLVLEHVGNLDHVFQQAAKSLEPGGHIYIGELHPFKQYTGSKARFETDGGLNVLECFTHHISDFTNAAKKYDLLPVTINEYFDEENKTGVPRILSIVFRKTNQ